MLANPSAPRNRLSIAHLMLWTLGTAIALALHRLATDAGPFERSETWWQYALVYCLLAGPKIGGLLLFIGLRGTANPSFPTQPGHWLLAIEGLSTVLVYGGHIFASRFDTSLWAQSQLPNCIITACVYAAAYQWQSQETAIWRVAFMVLAAMHAMAGFFNLAAAAAGMGVVLPMISSWIFCFEALPLLLGVAAFTDQPLGRRDFLHWAGVATVAGSEILHLAMPHFA